MSNSSSALSSGKINDCLQSCFRCLQGVWHLCMSNIDIFLNCRSLGFCPINYLLQVVGVVCFDRQSGIGTVLGSCKGPNLPGEIFVNCSLMISLGGCLLMYWHIKLVSFWPGVQYTEARGTQMPLGNNQVDIFYQVSNLTIWIYYLLDPCVNGVPFLHAISITWRHSHMYIIRHIRSCRERC